MTKAKKEPEQRVYLQSLTVGTADLTIVSPDAHLRKRLVAYLEQFEVAEGLVLGLRGKTTQLISVSGFTLRQGDSMYRVFLGDQFVGTVLAGNELEARQRIGSALVTQGYNKRCVERLRAVDAVMKAPTKALIDHLVSAKNDNGSDDDSATHVPTFADEDEYAP